MTTGDFSSLEQIFQMFTPSDIVGTVQPNLGGPLQKVDNAFVQLLALLENNGRGVLSISDLQQKILDLKSNSQLGNVDLSKFITIWTNGSIVDLGPSSATDKIAVDSNGNSITVEGLNHVIGPSYTIPPAADGSTTKVSLIMSRTPFFNPATRNTSKAEIFLNSMPATVLAQLVPYMQVEFQFTRDPSELIQTMGTLKFLGGASDKSKMSAADKAMAESHQINKQSDVVDPPSIQELDFAGMEMFTSPQTMINPTPNKSVGSGEARYTDIIDPFRPFATLEHVTINAVPSGAGFYCYKKANMSLKIHDRSRLNEISDLLRPRVYTGVTIWLTYGWRAPERGPQNLNPYFSYVNNNLMMREAYHIINSNFTFDHVGQVTINLELFTKGVMEMRDLKISDNNLDSSFVVKKLKDAAEKISQYRQKLHLDPPEGLNKEIRTYQILDAAESRQFPAFKAQDVKKSIDALQKSLAAGPHPDSDSINGLTKLLKDIYTSKDGSKFVYKEQYDSLVSSTIADMFNEVLTGPDPFIPSVGKGTPDVISQMCDKENKTPTTVVKVRTRPFISFGKLFSVFALRCLTSIPESVDEIQVFFYNLNESCGPISTCSIAEFPIDIHAFYDAFHDMVKTKGGEQIKLEEFLSLAINSQFLDNRALGYGLRTYYDSKGNVKSDQQGQFESALAALSTQYGPFNKPVVEMYIEMSHQKVAESGQSDILQLLNYSAKDATSISLKDAQHNATRKIMRIHFYDKQTIANKAASQLLRNKNNTAFLDANPSLDDIQSGRVQNVSQIYGSNPFLNVPVSLPDGRTQVTNLSAFKGNQQIKDVVSKLVPTIRFGANGTTISIANLASKADPLLSTVQMQRSMNIRNTAGPNGSGDLGIPLRVIPAQLTMTTLGNPLATMAQQYFIDFQTGTTLDNLYIVTALNHTFSPGKFETQWTFGYCDAYGVFEGAPNILTQLEALTSAPGGSTGK